MKNKTFLIGAQFGTGHPTGQSSENQKAFKVVKSVLDPV
jgi:hypothetical protein